MRIPEESELGGLDNPESGLHPCAIELLDLLNRPALLEILSSKGVEAALRRDGYRPADDFSRISIGWPSQVGHGDKANTVIFQIPEGQILCLSIGHQGDYKIGVMVENIQRPSADELRDLQAGHVIFRYCKLSERFQAFCALHAIPLPQARE